MRAVIQRVSAAEVSIDNKPYASISQGLLILLGITSSDNAEDIDWVINKLINMRIFNDDSGKMNLSVQDVNGEFLVVSQFTLHASTKKGNRPSFIGAAPPAQAESIYNDFLMNLNARHDVVKSGKFGAMMNVSLVSDGPVTILMDSKSKE